MLKKLIRHEFRATSRVMWPVFAGMLALTVLVRLSLALLDSDVPWLMELLAVLIVVFFFFALAALSLAPLVLTAARWRDHVLRDEGYLTLTLPVNVHELLLSKLIVSAVWYAAAFAVALAALLIAAMGWREFFYLPETLAAAFSAYFEADGATKGHMLLIGLELLGNFVFVVSAAALMVYAAYSIGFAAKTHKTLFTTLLVLAFVLAAQLVAMWMIGEFINAAPHFWRQMTSTDVAQAVELFLLWGMLGELVFVAAGYAMTWYFTTKKLNLA